jgi:hypothetical protein
LERPVLTLGVKSYAVDILSRGASVLAGKGSRWRLLVYALVPAFAVLAAWLSGFIETSFYEYGFPLPWKTVAFGWVCPPGPVEIACFLTRGQWTVFDWSYFALDAMFYSTISYATIFGSQAAMGRLFPRKTLHLSNRQDLRVSDNTWILIFILSVIAITLWIVHLMMMTTPRVYTQ